MASADALATKEENNSNENSLLTSRKDSVDSPAPAHSLTFSADKREDQEEHDHKDLADTPDDETVYPSTTTKISVGIGLALAVFLVYFSFKYITPRLIVFFVQ